MNEKYFSKNLRNHISMHFLSILKSTEARVVYLKSIVLQLKKHTTIILITFER